MPYDGVDGGHWRALPMVDVGEALGHPHDAHDGDHLPWHSSCACGAFLSLLEHYGWCSSRILRLGGEDAFDDVLYPLYGGDAHERMFVDEDSCFLAPLDVYDVWTPLLFG